jgi:importin-7
MLPSLDNYITFGAEVIKYNVEYQKMFCDIAFTIFQRAEEAGEQDLVRACQLFESILLNLRSTVDAYIPMIISVVYPFILPKVAKTISFKVHALEVLVNCILYNTTLTLSIMQQLNFTQTFFDIWMEQLPEFARVHDIRLCVCAFTSLLEIPELEVMYPRFVIGIVGLLEEFPDAMKERERIGKMMKGDEDDLEDGGIEVNLNDDETGQVDELKLELESNGYKLDSDNVDDDESDDYNYGSCGLEEDPYFETVLDSIDLFARVKSVLSVMNPAVQQSIMAGLSQEQAISLQKMLA